MSVHAPSHPLQDCSRHSEIAELEKAVHSLDIQMATINGNIRLLTQQNEAQSKSLDKIATTIDSFGRLVADMVRVEGSLKQTAERYGTLDNKMDKIDSDVDSLRSEVQQDMDELREEMLRYRDDQHRLALTIQHLSTANKIIAGVLSVIAAALLGAWFQKLV